MNENENNFESLRRLLALKRHEIPPPGYFNNFSGAVISRIRAGETSESVGDWFSKLLQVFEFKPAFAGAFASALFLLLVFGIIFAEQPDSAPQPLLQAMTQNNGSVPQLASVSSIALPQTDQTGIIASTNPVLNLQPIASLFGQQNPFAQQVSFSPSGN
ncbi:MAG TPA: hypothetical protein VK840_04785 [Candidatus Dormibacteraeota bacterium]|nr:hypothetical protein [Candidatus Dormibacteraeota bacterium]